MKSHPTRAPVALFPDRRAARGRARSATRLSTGSRRWRTDRDVAVYVDAHCRRRIKMSPLCQLEMTLPRGFLGGVRGDGLADERWGADAARSAAGSGSKTIDDRGGSAIAEARASSGIQVVEGVPDRGSGGPDLEATRSPQQPAQARGASERGTDDHSRMVLGFRPDPGGREAARSSWDHDRP